MTKAIAAPAPPQRVPSVATVEANDDPTQLVVLLNELTGELMEITASETIEESVKSLSDGTCQNMGFVS